MDAELEPCTRCGDNAVAYDPTGSCFVCQSCGHVPHEQGLVSYNETTEQLGEQHGSLGGGSSSVAAAAYQATQAAHGGRAAGGAPLGPGPYDPRTAAVIRSAADPAGSSRARRQRRELDELQALAAKLRQPGPVAQLAAGFLARIHQGATTGTDSAVAGAASPGADPASGADGVAADDAYGDLGGDTDADADGDDSGRAEAEAAGPRVSVPAMGGAQSAARLGALLYLASRSERGTLTLAEVGAATATDMFRVGELARQQAAFLRLANPAVDVERFVNRLVMELIASGQLQLQRAGAGGGAAAGPAAAGGGGGDGGGASGAVLSETELRSHPLARCASQLTGLVVRRGWHEGKTPRTVAGAVLSISMDALYPPGAREGTGGPMSTVQLARWAMCGPGTLASMKQELLSQLVRLASALPFGPLVAPTNVASYLDVLVAADGVMLGPQGGGTQ